MGLVFGNDLHGELGHHVRMEAGAHGVFAQGADGSVEQDAAAVDIDTFGGQSIADDGRGDRTVQLVVFTHAHGDGKHQAASLEAASLASARRASAGLELFALQFEDAQVGGGGQHGQSLRNQIVAAVTGLYQDNVAQVAEVFHIGANE